MNKEKILTQDRLKTLLPYDPDTGNFTRVKSKNQNKVGSVAGSKEKFGYVSIKMDGKSYRANRLSFLYMTGCFPVGIVDHINGNPSDDRWCNLRDVDYSQNCMNSRTPKTNKSGVKGVCWDKRDKRWKAQIFVKGIKKHIGNFKDLISAELAVKKYRNEHHGEFANHG